VSLLSVLSNGELPLAVKVNDLSITYRTTFERKPTLKQALVRFGRGQRAVREIEAIKHVSFEVRTGTAMGIIGSNGAGKSTLMRAMAGILPPTSGSIEVWGRASTLLALGVGFNHNLSGRENIILGGLAAGLSRREVEERAEEVAEWTELGDFIDMPMETYSSGMSARVGFSVAVHMKPDILMNRTPQRRRIVPVKTVPWRSSRSRPSSWHTFLRECSRCLSSSLSINILDDPRSTRPCLLLVCQPWLPNRPSRARACPCISDQQRTSPRRNCGRRARLGRDWKRRWGGTHRRAPQGRAPDAPAVGGACAAANEARQAARSAARLPRCGSRVRARGFGDSVILSATSRQPE
jgi:hypothetical protein